MPAAEPTTAELLASVRIAIKQISDGAQSWTVNGQNFNKANLADLIAYEKDLMARLNQEAAGGNGISWSWGEFVR